MAYFTTLRKYQALVRKQLKDIGKGRVQMQSVGCIQKVAKVRGILRIAWTGVQSAGSWSKMFVIFRQTSFVSYTADTRQRIMDEQKTNTFVSMNNSFEICVSWWTKSVTGCASVVHLDTPATQNARTHAQDTHTCTQSDTGYTRSARFPCASRRRSAQTACKTCTAVRN